MNHPPAAKEQVGVDYLSCSDLLLIKAFTEYAQILFGKLFVLADPNPSRAPSSGQHISTHLLRVTLRA